MKVLIISAIILSWACAALSGCSSQSGWRVSFGVSPVAAISETQTTTDKRKVE